MVAGRVQGLLVFRYLKATHASTYGRNPRGGGYTKDYLQLPQSHDFAAAMDFLFPPETSATDARPLHLQWSRGSTDGEYAPISADRPHLKWGTNEPPPPWRMTLAPRSTTIETIPGDPTYATTSDADAEFDALASRGAGMPYLMAIKLFGQTNTLHLRAFLDQPDRSLDFADIRKLPVAVLDVVDAIRPGTVTGWKVFSPADDLWFDPEFHRNPWDVRPETHFEDNDIAAEHLPGDPGLIQRITEQVRAGNYSVPDTHALVRSRGSAQQVFASAVKLNYGFRCAITGVTSREFLVASHIVPWSLDQTIRADPSNGLCLSLMVDRAFEYGYLVVADDLTVSIDRRRIGTDAALERSLEQYEGAQLVRPSSHPPRLEYLRRRRDLYPPT